MGRFPDHFRWGTATSSYQIEGAVAEGGRGPSVWDTFCRVPGAISDGTTGDVACEHYHRYREDVALMAGLGLDDYRFSIAWPRIQPNGTGKANSEGIDFYSRLVDELLDHDIAPFVTLYHWDLPQALEDRGGWRARDTAARFAEYAQIVAQALGDRVLMFTTLNEPWCSAFLGYADGEHAPGGRNPADGYLAAHHLLLAHGMGTAAMRAVLPAAAQVSLTVNPTNVRADSESVQDLQVARWAALATNEIFLDPVLTGVLSEELVAASASVTDWDFVQDGDLATIAAPIDFLGVNYYCPHLVGATQREGSSRWAGVPDAWAHEQRGPVTGMGWRVEPASLTELLVGLSEQYPGVPFVVTENGSAWPDAVEADGSVHDEQRAAYLSTHIDAVADAIAAGVDLRGYFAWSLLDNFEWGWGLSQRFGLVHVDFDTQRRTMKTSGETYRMIIADHRRLSGPADRGLE
ncbi:MAG: GH1 family beta-glucosidase [Jatrophihabitans sp.]